MKRDRWLSMVEVAELMKLPHQNVQERRRYVRRAIRRLEQRDGTRYLRRFGVGRNSKLFVAVSALEQLMPWDPGTLTAMRGQIGELGVRTKRLERRVDGHQKDITKLHDWTKRFAGMVEELPSLLGPK